MALNRAEAVENLSQTDHSEEIRTCWICFGTDEDNPTLPWVQPCSCRGSGKWVHQTCLLLWVDEKKKENRSAKITCPQCKVEYIIIFPKCDPLMSFVQVIDDLVYKVCPVVAAGVTVGIIFWAASSYGAFTVMQIFGEEEGLSMLDRADPFVLLLFLPTIPTALISMKLVRWEDYVLSILRRGSKYPILRHILPSSAYNEVMGQRIDILPQPSDVSSTRIFVGGLFLPTIAKIFGDVFFHTEQSCLKKFLLGGLSFIAIKGALKMYYKQKTYIQHSQRRVLNHHEHTGVGTVAQAHKPNPTSGLQYAASSSAPIHVVHPLQNHGAHLNLPQVSPVHRPDSSC
ncbi:E3 ubiquitin-protein ligase march5 [Homalodisca vitripennis]|nr:E3 ubiquitin-protein ligase march5 [Homalodisca vitripennis]